MVKVGTREFPIVEFIAYLGTGLSLISNSYETKNVEFVYYTGLILCLYAIILAFISIIFPKLVTKFETFNSNLKIALFPLTLMTVTISALKAAQNQHLGAVIILIFGFASAAVIYMFVNIVKKAYQKITSIKNYRSLLYIIFSRLGIIFALFGLFLVIYGIFDPETTSSLTNMNKWAYNPMLYFLLALFCVVPTIIFDP